MDKDKSVGRRENQEEIDLTNPDDVEKLRREFVGEPPKKDAFDEVRKYNEQVMQEFIDSIDKDIKSRWVLPKDKSYLRLFRHIMVEQQRMADTLTSMSEALMQWNYSLKQTIFNIFLEIEVTKGLTQKDLGTVKSRMEKILDSPAVKQLEQIMTGNQEALNKLDKNRQKILRDSIV